jgi:long-subunit fatty acid transport protein
MDMTNVFSSSARVDVWRGDSAQSRVVACLAGLLLVLASTSALAQTQDPAQRNARTDVLDAEGVVRSMERRPAVTPRSLGLAGTGVAGVGDVSALYSNPAGLGYAASSQAGGGLSILTTQSEATYQLPGTETGSTLGASEPNTALSNVSAIYKVPTEQGSLTFGLAYYRTAAFTQEAQYDGEAVNTSVTGSLLPNIQNVSFPEGQIDFFNSPRALVAFEGGAIEFFEGDLNAGRYPFQPAVFPGSRIRQIGEVDRNGSMNEINAGVAFEAAPGVMIGGSGSITFGSYELRQELREIDIAGDNDNYEVIRGGQTYLGLSQIQYEDGFEDRFVGVNLRLGVSAKLTETLKLGVTFESPTWNSVERDFTRAAVRTTFDDGRTLSYGLDGQFDDSESFGGFDYETRSPLRLSGGLAYDSERLFIGTDVEFVDWSQINVNEVDFAGAISLPQLEDAIDDNYSYVMNVRTGIEYRLEQGLDVRAGLAYRPDPREGLALTGATERDRVFLSAGLGYSVNDQFRIDFGWMHQRTEDQFQPYDSGPVPGLSTTYAAPVIEDQLMKNTFMLGFMFNF